MKNILQPEVLKTFLDALETKDGKKTIFIDMDGVIADFDEASERWGRNIGISAEEFKEKKMYRQKDFYADLNLMEGAKDAIEKLDPVYNIAFVSAPSWDNPHSFTEKRIWIEKQFGAWSRKKMDLSFRKGHYIGHYLIDDRKKYGAADFIGEHIMFGTEPFNTWKEVTDYLIK
jgi:5'(3')-deoxyribonucleotidase